MVLVKNYLSAKNMHIILDVVAGKETTGQKNLQKIKNTNDLFTKLQLASVLESFQHEKSFIKQTQLKKKKTGSDNEPIDGLNCAPCKAMMAYCK